MRYIFLSCLFFVLPVWARPCGLEGTVEERIKNCDFASGSFVLVARDDKGVEIYKDLKTGLLWGDRIKSDFNQYGSSKACSSGIPEAGILKGFSWRLPSIREFERAAANGMKEALPNMNHSFWSSTPVKIRKKRTRGATPMSFLWDGNEQRTDTGDSKDAASVRCVSVIPKGK